MNKLTRKEVLKIIESSRYSVIHIDGDWDNYRFEVNEQLNEIKAKYIGKVSFAYIDCDQEQEYAKEIQLRNTPSIAYYEGDELKAVVLGVNQDINSNIELLTKSMLIDQ